MRVSQDGRLPSTVIGWLVEGTGEPAAMQAIDGEVGNPTLLASYAECYSKRQRADSEEFLYQGNKSNCLLFLGITTTSVTTALHYYGARHPLPVPRRATLLEAIQARVANEWGSRPGELLAACLVPVWWSLAGQRPDVCISSHGGEDMHDSRKCGRRPAREQKPLESRRCIR